MPQGAISSFWLRLAGAGRGVLLLDYDGTLSPFRKERDQATPYPGVTAALGRILAGQRTRVVVVTGRNARDIPRLLKLEPKPEIWGSHGLERFMPDGQSVMAELDSTTTGALSALSIWVRRERLERYVEEKPGCIAFHWRGLPENEAMSLRAMVEPIMQHYATGMLELKSFDGGLELRASTSNKATVVDVVLREEPDAAAAYLGDDLTDEDAFRAIDGRGLAVLVRSEYRDTAAQAWIHPPEELVQFLTTWQHVLNGFPEGGAE